MGKHKLYDVPTEIECPSCEARPAKDLLGLPLDEEKDPDKLRNMVKYLWGLLDDIDTLDDAVKEDSEWFRTRTYAVQQKRYRILTSDGYSLFLPKEKKP